MKVKNAYWAAGLLVSALFAPAAFADAIGHGRDGDIPDNQPPTETETTTTTKNMLQQLLELFGVDAE